jgi:helix-turn-helix protein
VKTVNPDEKTLIVVEKKTGDEVTVTVTDETVFINAKGKQAKRFDLKAFKKREGKAKVAIEHEDGVASKITITPPKKKKGAPAE